MAEQFARDLARVEGARLIAVSSRSTEKAQAFARRHGNISAYSSSSDLLADEDVDAVYVASPNDTHFDTAWAALAARKAVLVEKPLVATSAEASRLAQFAAKRKTFLMEAMWTRFLPAVVEMKRAVAAGAIGDVRRITSELAFHHPYAADSRFFSKERGGGSLLDLGVYGISLALHLMGKPKDIRGSWRAAPTGVDNSATVELAFAGGVEAHLVSALDRMGSNIFVIEGTCGTLILQPPFIGARMVLKCQGPARRLPLARGGSFAARAIRKLARTVPLPGITRQAFPFEGYGLQFEIDAASAAIRAGHIEHPLSPLSDTIETLRIIETMLKGARLS